MSIIVYRKPITPFQAKAAGFLRKDGSRYQREISGGHWVDVSPVMYEILKTKGHIEVQHGRIQHVSVF